MSLHKILLPIDPTLTNMLKFNICGVKPRPKARVCLHPQNLEHSARLYSGPPTSPDSKPCPFSSVQISCLPIILLVPDTRLTYFIQALPNWESFAKLQNHVMPPFVARRLLLPYSIHCRICPLTYECYLDHITMVHWNPYIEVLLPFIPHQPSSEVLDCLTSVGL